MNYSDIDPSVYGIKVSSTQGRPTGLNLHDDTRGNEDSSAAGGVNSSAPPSSATSKTLSAVSNTNQSAGHPPNRTEEAGAIYQPPSSPTTAGTSSSSAAPRPRVRVAANPQQQERLEARKQRSEEARKRLRRERIAQAVGHEVDSEGEQEYWQAWRDRDRAEESRRNNLSPDARRREDIESASTEFRDHIKPQLAIDNSGAARVCYYPLFLLQQAPDSPNGATCRLPHCTDRILPGRYRIAVSPGFSDARSPDYYHVNCFEEMLDLSSPHYMARFEPDQRKHIADHGAQCILEEYLSRWRLRTCQTPKDREDAQNPSSSKDVPVEGSSTQLYSSTAEEDQNSTGPPLPPLEVQSDSAAPNEDVAGPNESPSQTASVPGTTVQLPSTSKNAVDPDVWTIADTLWARIRESRAEIFAEDNAVHDVFLSAGDAKDLENAPADQDRSWHITQYLLPADDPDYDERHALSQALGDWTVDMILANRDVNDLSEAGRAAKEALGELTVKRISRYSSVRMPNYQSLFLGGR